MDGKFGKPLVIYQIRQGFPPQKKFMLCNNHQLSSYLQIMKIN